MSDDVKVMFFVECSFEGGSKDMNDLSDIKGIQDIGMVEKVKQVDQIFESVFGIDVIKCLQ